MHNVVHANKLYALFFQHCQHCASCQKETGGGLVAEGQDGVGRWEGVSLPHLGWGMETAPVRKSEIFWR